MVRDVNLQLISGATAMAGTGVKGSVVDTEGGFFALVSMLLGTCTGTPEVSVAIQASIDGGSNYFHIGQFPILDEDDDDIEISRVVWVPKPTLASSLVTKVRLNTVVSSGGSPVVPVNQAFLEPLASLAGPGIDLELTQGVEKLT
ncbi:hypothetical protein LCGC14_0970370 [marine sediment metagenome]|uniref:Uncharacterized protein n=1 Tax=marine sediment metagenome TaxID=412755 RepID=A0A0F9RI81_9ZZZZ